MLLPLCAERQPAQQVAKVEGPLAASALFVEVSMEHDGHTLQNIMLLDPTAHGQTLSMTDHKVQALLGLSGFGLGLHGFFLHGF